MQKVVEEGKGCREREGKGKVEEGRKERIPPPPPSYSDQWWYQPVVLLLLYRVEIQYVHHTLTYCFIVVSYFIYCILGQL